MIDEILVVTVTFAFIITAGFLFKGEPDMTDAIRELVMKRAAYYQSIIDLNHCDTSKVE